ncbi:hypothetical protein [Immundisolibacter sp.]|uniref:hypothetical protein n=1 Tax=Immundisolibacter sp. TaxID=1934948 RepID=UPI00356A7F0C
MTDHRNRLRGIICAVALLAGPAFGMGQGLKVCLESGPPPLSSKERGGIDMAVAEQVADWLGRPLEIIWYEVEDDSDSSPAAQVNGLLSAGVCQLAGGFPLVSDGLRVPLTDTYPLVLPDGSRRFVKLGTPIHTAAYRSVDFRVVLGAAEGKRAVSSLDELRGLPLLAGQNTLADHILLAHGGGVLRPDVVHVPMLQAGVLAALEKGHGAAALVEGPQFDAYKKAHPDSHLRDGGYQHPLQVNVGFVALDTRRGLVDLFDQAISDLLAEGDIKAEFVRLGYRFLMPGQPQVLPPLTLRLLAQPAGGS